MKALQILSRFTISAGLILAAFAATVSARNFELPAIDPADFNSPMDNVWLPMSIGLTYVYEAIEEDGLVVNEITQTDEIKMIQGVACTVVEDVEWIYLEELGDWLLTEETLDWIAWDNWGNVWYFGEETTEYIYDEEGELVETSSEGSWEAGVDGAEAGILMLAQPWPGLAYFQEYYEGEAEDMARVLRLNAHVNIDFGNFKGCLMTKEWTPLDPGVNEIKYYASGVGLIFIRELKEKTVYVRLVEIVDPVAADG